jgi:hypothetical protein
MSALGSKWRFEGSGKFSSAAVLLRPQERGRAIDHLSPARQVVAVKGRLNAEPLEWKADSAARAAEARLVTLDRQQKVILVFRDVTAPARISSYKPATQQGVRFPTLKSAYLGTPKTRYAVSGVQISVW